MSETEKDVLTGRCLCGAVSVEARPATALDACHCRMCQHWTGSAFVAFEVEGGTFAATGPARTFTSSDWAERAWCDECGSALWYRVTLPGHERHAVAAGLFENAGGLELEEEIFIDVKPHGYAFAGTHETKTEAEMQAIFASFAAGA